MNTYGTNYVNTAGTNFAITAQNNYPTTVGNTFGNNVGNNYGTKLDILKKGYLIHKRHTKIFVILCSPLSISDVSTVYYSVFGNNGGLENRAAILGNICFAAMEETPLLILLPNEKETNRPIFIHFMNVNGIDDEVKLGQACCMRLHTTKADFTFSAPTSTDYQDWITAFKDAYKKSHPAQKRKTLMADIDDVDDIEDNSADNIDPNVFIPYNPSATVNRSKSNGKSEKPLLGRLFSQCIPDSNSYSAASNRPSNANKPHHHQYNAASSKAISSSSSPRHRASSSAHRSSSAPIPGSSSSSSGNPNAVVATASYSTSPSNGNGINVKKSVSLDLNKPTPPTSSSTINTNAITRASLPPSIPTPINTTTTITPLTPASVPSASVMSPATPTYKDMPPLSPPPTLPIISNNNPLANPNISLPPTSGPIKVEIQTEPSLPIKTN